MKTFLSTLCVLSVLSVASKCVAVMSIISTNSDWMLLCGPVILVFNILLSYFGYCRHTEEVNKSVKAVLAVVLSELLGICVAGILFVVMACHAIQGYHG